MARAHDRAAWLVAVAHRTEFRDLIGRLLLASFRRGVG
ncbi:MULTISPECIES: DUF6000 family protein [unclassified Streptomyces]